MQNEIKTGERVILFFPKKRKKILVEIEADKEIHTHLGIIRLNDLIGKEYGSSSKSNSNKKFFVLKPDLSDHLLKFRRPTQVLYLKDAALIILQTGICSGSIVVEAGTGSGSLTSFLAYYVKPDGKVYSYELKEEILRAAKKNLAQIGLDDYVELICADVTEGIRETDVDAVILDLASPWDVIPHAHRSLKGGGLFASFSPTYNQVEKTVLSLLKNGFTDIKTFECMLREIKVEEGSTRPATRMIGHTGFVTFAKKIIFE